MCHRRLIILLLLTSLTAICIKAQQPFNYPFRHITQSDGLLHNDVFSISQDGKGFIWIGTPNGLQRYDGSSFIRYPDILSNIGEGLTQGMDIYADKKSNLLWITNRNNTETMKLGKNNFTLYNTDTVFKNPSFAFTSYREPNNREWLLARNAIYYYDSSLKKYILGYINIHPANTYKTSTIVTDSNSNNTWVANYSQLFWFNKKNKTLFSSTANPAAHPLLQSLFYGARKASVKYVMMDSRQNVWVTTWGDAFYKYDNAAKKVSTFSLSVIKKKEGQYKTTIAGLIINCIMEDDNHTIWIGTEGAGLLRYNTAKDNFDYCIERGNNSESIWYNYKIRTLFQDREQNIWIGTDRGISIFNPYRQYFTSIRYEENNPLSISKSEIISFTQIANGDMYVGTWGRGIGVYDNNFKFKKNIFFKDPYQKNFVWSFQQVDDETLWIGCQHGYLLVYNILTGVTQTMRPREMDSSTIRCMEKDVRGNIWFGLHNGRITKWDKKLNKFFNSDTGPGDTLKVVFHVSNIFIDILQHCWVSTDEGGFKEFDLEKMIYTNTWLPDKNNETGISSKNCQGVEEYNDSTLIIGTIHGGLSFFNKRTKTFTHITTAEGLPSNNIYAIKKDAAGYTWFTTDYGLYKFNPTGKKIIPYTMDQGLINSSLLSTKFYPLQDGHGLRSAPRKR
jgi:ligand-binding sensor domain-containing protein